ncbi:MAG: hypothetical protein HY064_12895 [Bacteroidetes bacterium]|nr:hypothetical protein [Bacteroidota bacterium]
MKTTTSRKMLSAILSVIIMGFISHLTAQFQTSTNEVDVDISDQPKGIYFVRCNINGEIKVLKYINQ